MKESFVIKNELKKRIEDEIKFINADFIIENKLYDSNNEYKQIRKNYVE
jgi:hypothetical protein